MPVEFIADLHIHTCLSPCAELSMTPRGIVNKAASLGINMLAICDHNAAENVGVTVDLARRKGISVIAAMEITSAEEVHVLGFFRDTETVLRLQSLIHDHLQPGENDEEGIGMQVVVNADDEVMGFNRRLLIGATDLSVNRIVGIIHEMGGIAVASHIDREGFGIIGQLGFISTDIGFDALEISFKTDFRRAWEHYNAYRHIPWFSSSDAHRINEIGRRTSRFIMNHATFEELCLALRGADDRKIYF